MHIRPIASTDDAFTAWHDVYWEAASADYPDGPRYGRNECRVLYQGNEYHDVELWLAEIDGQAVGAALLGLPLRDNLSLAEPEIWVRSDARRQGVGTALLNVVKEAARQRGRSSLLSYLEGPASTPETPGTAFAEHHGFTRRITEIARAQRAPFDLGAIAKAEEEARPHAIDYEIVTWRGDTPDEYVAELARLEGRMSTDAPLGTLDYEAEVWDAQRIRAAEERLRRRGRESWMAAALATDGSMAGYTQITVPEDRDDVGLQESTIVDPAHRGHRLGLLLKAANIRAVLRDRPSLQAVWTWNADSNGHMIAINETLGYRIEGWATGYQRDL